MIYHSYNFVDSFSNASGNRRDSMVLGELGKVIRNHPKEVIIALKDAEINVPANVNKKGLIKLILKNKRNKRMINNLSLLIYTSTSFDGGNEFLGRNKSKDGADAGSSDEKGGVLARVGQWISDRKERKAQQQGGATADSEKKTFWQKLGSIFNKNKDKIGDISSTLATSLQNQNKSSETLNANIKSATTSSTNAGNTTGGMSKNTKIAIGIGLALIVGFVIYKKVKK